MQGPKSPIGPVWHVQRRARGLLYGVGMMTRRNTFIGASIAFAIGILSACGGTAGGGGGGGGTISASSYDQSCSKANDCAPVFQGTVACCGGGCANAAINKKDLASYDTAFGADTPSDCTGLACPAIACVEPNVACVAGKCAVAPVRTFDGGPGEGGTVACGAKTCSGGDVCVMDQFEGGALHTPNDAGLCPDGDVKIGAGCNPAPTFHCAPEPAACSGALSCGCAQSLCQSGYSCMTAKNGLVGCYLLAP